MRERILFLAFLLFIPCVAHSAPCSSHNYPSLNEMGCKNEAGCYVKTVDNGKICDYCATNHYCPQGAGDAGSPTGAYECPEPFNHSTAGTMYLGDCYAPCYYNINDANDIKNSDNHEYTTNCGYAYGNYHQPENPLLVVSCIQNGILTMVDDYHIEILDDSNGEFGCYLDSRPCNLFAAKDNENNDITTPDDITGDIEWSTYENTDPYYDTTSCEYKTLRNNFNSRNCDAYVTYRPDANITSVTASIVFDTFSNYYCAQCSHDNFYPKINSSYTGCTAYDNIKVCRCDPIPQGFYRTTEWHAGISPNNTYTGCPTGKTTDRTHNNQPVGGSSVYDCKYTSDTKFCDAKGCFNINDAASDDWTWSY